MTVTAHFPPFDPSDWVTIPAAASETGLPEQLIEQAILAGGIAVRLAVGARVVRRSEVHAMRLRMQGRRCEECSE